MRQVALDAETVLDVRVQGHLVRHGHVFQNVLGLPPLLCREDEVGFCGSNAQRPRDALELVDLDEAWMGSEAGIEGARLEPPADILASETVAHASQALHAEVAAQILDDGGIDGVDGGFTGHLVFFPAGEVEVRPRVEGNGVAVEDVGNDGEVAVGCKLVCDTWVCQSGFQAVERGGVIQLHVWELEAEDVRHDEDGVLGAAVLRVGHVRADCMFELACIHVRADVRAGVRTVANALDLALGGALVLDADDAALLHCMGSHVGRWRRGHLSREALTGEVGGWSSVTEHQLNTWALDLGAGWS